MEQLIVDLADKYPSLMSVAVVLGIFRAIFKPLVSLYQAYVESTPSQDDDIRLEKIKSSSIYKSISWFVDYLFSIKLPKSKPKSNESV